MRIQIGRLSGPTWPDRGKRRHDGGICIESADWIGLPSLGAAGVEQKIMKIPKHEVTAAFRCAQAVAVAGLELEQDLAIQQQSQKFKPGKALLLAITADRLRLRQRGKRGADLGIANS